MITVTLYTRKNDPASDQARADLTALQTDFEIRLVEVDVESDPAVLKAFGDEAPVVEVGPYRIKSPFDKQKLKMTIGAASDRRGQLDKLGREDHYDRVQRGQAVSSADKVMYWLSRHYLAVLNVMMLFYFGLPLLAPVLMNAGLKTPANIIYTIYKPLCHQFAFRSFFLFGEQPYYPLAEAGIPGVRTFEEVTGIVEVSDPTSYARFEARNFIGNALMGYKMALCERDMAIYAAIFLFGLLYAATGRRLKPLHWLGWILIGMVPIGLDGFSQLFSQMEWNWLVALLPYRESTPLLRVITGALFGFATAWFAYPYMEESMAESRQFFVKKFAALSQSRS
jgi:uncharacterized membrane protein